MQLQSNKQFLLWNEYLFSVDLSFQKYTYKVVYHLVQFSLAELCVIFIYNQFIALNNGYNNLYTMK